MKKLIAVLFLCPLLLAQPPVKHTVANLDTPNQFTALNTFNAALATTGITFIGLPDGCLNTVLGVVTSTGLPCGTGGGGGSVASVFGRTGSVVAALGDYSVGQVTGAAPLASPTFTGTFTISGIATGCATFTTGVLSSTGVACGSGGGGAVTSVFGRTGVVTAQTGDYAVGQVIGAAPLASPTFTGTVSGITNTMVGLGNVSNNAQAFSSIWPNTAPASSQIPVGNGSSYINKSISGDSSMTSGGVMTNTGMNGVQMSSLTTGIVKNTTGSGSPSIAVAGDFPTLNQNTTGTASNLSGTPSLPNGTTATTQSAADNSTRLATDAFVLANAISNPMTTLGDTIYGGPSGVPTDLSGPTGVNGVPQMVSETPASGLAVAPVWGPVGVPINPHSSTSYTIAATDRASYLTFSNAGAIAVTLPQAGTSGFANNFIVKVCDIGAGTATVTPTTSTISYTTGSSYTSGATSMPITTGQCAFIYSNNTNYFADFGGGSGGTCSNCLVNNSTNTGTSAITLDLSAATTANAFKVPVGAGLTSGADGVIAYDSTNKNTHIRTNGADSIGLAVASIPATGDLLDTLVASSNTLAHDSGIATANVVTSGSAFTSNILLKGNGNRTPIASSITDNGSTITTTENIAGGSYTAGTSPSGTAGSSGGLIFAEGTAPTGLGASVDSLYPSSANGCLDWLHVSTDEGCLVPVSGATMTGKLTTVTSAASPGAGLNIGGSGVAPTSPVNGDLWMTTAGLFARVNGATVGPYGSGGGSSIWSNLLAPAATLSITMPAGDWSAFTWAANASPANPNWLWTSGADTGTSTVAAFSMIDTTGSTKTGPLLNVNTVGSSTALPIQVTAQGTANGIQMSTAGLLGAIGSGGINATQLGGKTFASPAAIGTGTAAAGTFTALNCGTTASLSCVFTGSGSTSGTATLTWPAISGTSTNAIVSSNNLQAPAFTSTVAIGTAPFVVTSTTNVANLNASSLSGATFASPGPIGSTTPGTGAFSSLTVGTAPACTTGTAGGECFTEGTAPTNVSGAADIYADSTSHELEVATNGSSNFGLLVRAQPGAIRSTGLVASVSTATLCAASAGACNTAGTYHVHIAMYQSGSACSANTTNGVSFQLTWHDANGTAHSAQTIPLQTNASLVALTGTMAWGATTVNAYGSGDFNIDTNGTIIQYATTFAQCTTGTATYALSSVVSRLQ